MKWTVMKNKETNEQIEIAYSFNSDVCDGVIKYDKKKEEFSILRTSETCDSYESERLYQFLFIAIDDNLLTSEKYNIVLG